MGGMILGMAMDGGDEGWGRDDVGRLRWLGDHGWDDGGWD